MHLFDTFRVRVKARESLVNNKHRLIDAPAVTQFMFAKTNSKNKKRFCVFKQSELLVAT